MPEKIGGGERVQDPNLAEEMAYAEKPYREKKHLFGLMRASTKDIELGEKAAESKRQAIEFKQPATELEGKVKDFCIVSWDIKTNGKKHFVNKKFFARFSVGDNLIDVKFRGSYDDKSNDKTVLLDENSFVVEIEGRSCVLEGDGEELFRKILPLLKTKADELIQSGRKDDDKDYPPEVRRILLKSRKWRDGHETNITEAQKIRDIIKAIR